MVERLADPASAGLRAKTGCCPVEAAGEGEIAAILCSGFDVDAVHPNCRRAEKAQATRLITVHDGAEENLGPDIDVLGSLLDESKCRSPARAPVDIEQLDERATQHLHPRSRDEPVLLRTIRRP